MIQDILSGYRVLVAPVKLTVKHKSATVVVVLPVVIRDNRDS